MDGVRKEQVMKPRTDRMDAKADSAGATTQLDVQLDRDPKMGSRDGVVAELIRELTRRERLVLMLRYTEELTVAEIAAVLEVAATEVERMLEWMLSTGVLWEEQGILGMGPTGEETFGRRNFMELLSVFLSPPLFTVLHGRDEIGFVDELTFHAKSAGPRVLLLGGRAWLVTYVDWGRKVAFVEPSEHRGLSRWQGDCRSLSYRVCQAIRTILAGEDDRPWWSNRAREQLVGLRQEYGWLTGEPGTEVVRHSDATRWWTFAGLHANASLAPALAEATGSEVTHESFCLTFARELPPATIDRAVQTVRERPATALWPELEERALGSLKFVECLPDDLARQILQHRLHDEPGLNWVLKQPLRNIVLPPG